MSKIRVKKSDPPETTEVLAEAIVRLGEAARKLRADGLNERAIIVLLNDYTKIGKKDIKIVLDGMRQLRAWYCR